MSHSRSSNSRPSDGSRASTPLGAAGATRRAWCLGALQAVLAGVVGAPWPLRAAAADGLEGRRFDTQAGMVGKPAHVPSDVLSFAAGLFHSSDCDQYQYGKGRYTSSVDPDGAIRFEAETESPTYGRNAWKGVIRGRAIEGEFVFYRKPTWWRPNPEPLPHWFKGHEVDAAGKPLG